MTKMFSSFMKFLVAEIYIIPLVTTGIFYNVYLSISIPLLSTGIVKQMPNPAFVLFPAFLIQLYVIQRIKAKFLITANAGQMVWKVREGKVMEVSRKYVWKFDEEVEIYKFFPVLQGNEIVISGTIPYTVSETQLLIPYTVVLLFKYGKNRYQELFDVFKGFARDESLNIESVVKGFVEHHAEARLVQVGDEERRDIKRVLEEVLAVPDKFKDMVCFGESKLQYKNPDQGLILTFTPGQQSTPKNSDQPMGGAPGHEEGQKAEAPSSGRLSDMNGSDQPTGEPEDLEADQKIEAPDAGQLSAPDASDPSMEEPRDQEDDPKTEDPDRGN